jgi:hypothetical protein
MQVLADWQHPFGAVSNALGAWLYFWFYGMAPRDQKWPNILTLAYAYLFFTISHLIAAASPHVHAFSSISAAKINEMDATFDFLLSCASNLFLMATCLLTFLSPERAVQIIGIVASASLGLLVLCKPSDAPTLIAYFRWSDAWTSAAAVASVGFAMLANPFHRRTIIRRLTTFVYGLWACMQVPYWYLGESALRLIYLYTLSIVALAAAILTLLFICWPEKPQRRRSPVTTATAQA